ncbi:hypothetical protein AOLI_G00105540 [Acnodon oligacanthus]
MWAVSCGGERRGRNKLVSEPAESPDGLADSHKPCSDSTVSAHWPIVLPQRPAHPTSPTWPAAKELKSSLSLRARPGPPQKAPAALPLDEDGKLK